jgi:hypothetical protein
LTWKQFVQKEDGPWTLVLPFYYAGLFEVCCPALTAKSKTGFRSSSTGKTRYAYFPPLDARDVNRIQVVLEFFERAVC